MYSSLPGRGLGGRASRLIAYGLGTAFTDVVVPAEAYVDTNVYGGGGKAYVPRYDWDDIIGDIDRRHRIMEEDEEVLQIIIEAILSGVIH